MDRQLREVLRDKPHRGYMGMTRGMVTAAFYRRYGHTPGRVVKSGCIRLAGPIPEVSQVSQPERTANDDRA